MSSLGTASVMYMKMTKNTFEIIPYEDRYKPELLAISLPWLEENDILEPADLEQLEHPEHILDKGGRILLARAGEEIIGMMMIELFGDGVCEFFKYGVKKPWRNRGVGRALMDASLELARELGQRSVVLTSHHSLTAALHIYESSGFRHAQHDHVAFELSDIAMEREL